MCHPWIALKPCDFRPRAPSATIGSMSSLPLQFLLLTIAGWITRDHQRVTEYLLAEMAVLREQLRGRRIFYTDGQRRRLATAAKRLGRKALTKLDTLVTPDRLMRWYRPLVARKYDGTTGRGTSRPLRTPDIVTLVLRMRKENAGWQQHICTRRCSWQPSRAADPLCTDPHHHSL